MRERLSQNRLHTLILWAFIAVGTAIRLAYLNRPAYLDESATFIDYAKLPFAEIASTYFDPNNHVFYSLLMHASYLAFGFDLWALRLPALLAGIAILPLTYLVARALYDPEIALLATGLAAVSAPLIEYSVSGRGYTLITAAFLLLLWLRTRTGIWRWPVLILISALGFYTLPTMLYPMGIVALWWGIDALWKREWREGNLLALSLIGGALLTLALYTPILREYGLGALAGNRHIVALSYPELLRELIRLPLNLLDYLSIGLPRPLQALLAVPLIAALLGDRWLSARRGFPLMIATIIWLLAWIAVQRVVPPVRVWVWLAPVFGMWVAAGTVGTVRFAISRIIGGGRDMSRPYSRMIWAVIPVIWGAFVLMENVNGGYAISSGAHDAEAAAAAIAELPSESEVLFVAGWVHPLWYYLETHDLPRERVQLNTPPSWTSNGPLYLLAFTEDTYRDNRTQEAFGVAYTNADLAPVTTFPTGEWTLYEVRTP